MSQTVDRGAPASCRAARRGPIDLGHVAQTLGVHKSTALRLLRTLRPASCTASPIAATGSAPASSPLGRPPRPRRPRDRHPTSSASVRDQPGTGGSGRRTGCCTSTRSTAATPSACTPGSTAGRRHKPPNRQGAARRIYGPPSGTPPPPGSTTPYARSAVCRAYREELAAVRALEMNASSGAESSARRRRSRHRVIGDPPPCPSHAPNVVATARRPAQPLLPLVRRTAAQQSGDLSGTDR